MPYCDKCGNKLDDSAMFCDKCGARVDDELIVATPASVDQPLVGDQKPQTQIDKTATKKTSKDANKKRLPLVITLCIVGAAIIGGGVFAAVKLLGNKKSSNAIVETIDVRKYFEENADIKDVSAVRKSKNNYSEKEIISELEGRGFNAFPITTKYSIDGKFVGSKEASNSSTEMHPIYETYYSTPNGYMWIITVVDGTITAYPSTYNLDHVERTPVLVSESEEIVSYDSSTNSFYRTVPKNTTMIVRVVDRIDDKTLESLKLEG